LVSFVPFRAGQCLFFICRSSTAEGIIKLFGFLILACGLIAIFGYLFGLPLMYYQFTKATKPMAINTALSFILLGADLVIIGKNKSMHEFKK
jgi:hypothetical protein